MPELNKPHSPHRKQSTDESEPGGTCAEFGVDVFGFESMGHTCLGGFGQGSPWSAGPLRCGGVGSASVGESLAVRLIPQGGHRKCRVRPNNGRSQEVTEALSAAVDRRVSGRLGPAGPWRGSEYGGCCSEFGFDTFGCGSTGRTGLGGVGRRGSRSTDQLATGGTGCVLIGKWPIGHCRGRQHELIDKVAAFFRTKDASYAKREIRLGGGREGHQAGRPLVRGLPRFHLRNRGLTSGTTRRGGR
jgi:hypothetical protein